MEFKAEDFSAADIALASAPGKGSFDPRTRCFSSAELRPLPVIRKRMKVTPSLFIFLHPCSFSNVWYNDSLRSL